MKKLFAALAIALAAVSGTASAAGNLYLGGAVGFIHNEENNGNKYNQFSILPEIGYNFSDTWTFGGQIGFQYTNYFAVPDTYRGVFKIAPYARYTFFRQGIVQLFVDGGVNFGLGTAKYGGGKDDTALTYGIGFYPGVALNFTKNFSMVAHLGMLGYNGCNDAAYNAGEPRKGGLLVDATTVTLGAYWNF